MSISLSVMFTSRANIEELETSQTVTLALVSKLAL